VTPELSAIVLGRGGWVVAAKTLSWGVVQLDEVVGIDVTVPAAAGYDDEGPSGERHPFVATVIEELDGDGSLEGEQQLVGVGVHLPGTGTPSGRSKDGEMAVVERHELVERELRVGASDPDGVMGIHDCIIVRHSTTHATVARHVGTTTILALV
jgi:hypothetical protein